MAVFMGAAFSPLGAGLCVLTSLILYLIYRLLYAPYHVHKQYGIKGPRPEPFWGSYSEIKKVKMNEFLEEGQKKYGSFYGFYVGSKFNVVVCDLDLIREIMIDHDDKLHDRGTVSALSRLMVGALGVPIGLLMASGDHWKSSRKALSPTFTGLKIRQMIPIVNKSCKTLVRKFSGAATSERSVNVYNLYAKFTMETITATVFGQQVEVQEGESSELIDATTQFLATFLDEETIGLEEIAVILSHFPVLKPLLSRLSRYMTASQAQMRLRMAGYKLVKARRSHTSPPQDVLQLMLDTQLEKEDGSKQNLSDQQIAAYAIDFLLASYETTASLLACVSYRLALHSEVQEKVQDEIDRYFKNKPESSVYEATVRTPYLSSVIQETMRMHPPVATLLRYCGADIELENHTVPKGVDVYIPLFQVHKNQDYWPQPHKFNPQRFGTGEKSRQPQLAHMPFGLGPHNCVGMKFALVEVKMALVALLRHYMFIRTPDTEVPLQLKHGAYDTPKNGIQLLIESR